MDLRDFESMWRALRAEESEVFGQRLNLTTHKWTAKNFSQLTYRYGPILYLRGRYSLGCRLMETALSMSARRKGWSFEMLWHVYKPLAHPFDTYDVTLAHFYSALGRDLTEWSLWRRFVSDLHPKVLRMSGISRADLENKSALLKPLFESIVAERRRRLLSGGTHGLRDLTESPSKVHQRQLKTKEKILKMDEDPRWEQYQRALESIFPELAKLAPRRSMREILEERGRCR